MNGTSRGSVEDAYSCLYDFPHGSSPVRSLTDDSKASQPTPLSPLNSNNQGSESKVGNFTSGAKPLSDVENVYAEVEGFNPNEVRMFVYLFIQIKSNRTSKMKMLNFRKK